MIKKTSIQSAVLWSLLCIAPGAQAKDWPAPIKALEAQGVEVMGTFEAPGGLTGYAGLIRQQALAIYLTQDGKQAIVGTMIDAKGVELGQETLDRLVSKPMAVKIWKQLEGSTWIADGPDQARRVVYVLTDPNCPYCNKLWSDARPWIDAGKLQLRHVMVGILTPTSAGKAAALLTSKNPAAALAAHERANMATNAKVMASGRPKPLEHNGVKALDKIPAAVQAQLDANQQLMANLRLSATPALVWLDDKGAVQMRTGAPRDVLAAAFGPL